jgi:hypothetical protein
MGYYAGDPGFFSLLKKGASLAASFIPGVGGVASKVISKIPTPVRAGAMRAGTMIAKHPVLSAAGAAGAIVVGEGAHLMGHHGRVPVPGMGGWHISKKTGKLVRNRHMRVTNPRALRRALRRAHGFAKLAMRTIHLVHPKKKVGFGGFKKRRKK